MKRFFMRAGTAFLLAAVLLSGVSCGVHGGGAETGTGNYAGASGTESKDSSFPETTHRAYAYTSFDRAERGETVSVTLSGCNPGERAVCRMKTASGWSNAKGLGLGTADKNGRITWVWRISAGVKTGDGFRVYLISEDGGLMRTSRSGWLTGRNPAPERRRSNRRKQGPGQEQKQHQKDKRKRKQGRRLSVTPLPIAKRRFPAV